MESSVKIAATLAGFRLIRRMIVLQTAGHADCRLRNLTLASVAISRISTFPDEKSHKLRRTNGLRKAMDCGRSFANRPQPAQSARREGLRTTLRQAIDERLDIKVIHATVPIDVGRENVAI